MRIVSLIASATEIVCALGLRDGLVGVSHECDYPPDVVGLPVLSRPKVDPRRPSAEVDRDVRAIVSQGLSVYEVDAALLHDVRPDLIVTQDHCEVCAVSLKDVERAVCAITDLDTRLCSLHPETLDDVRRDFQRVADAAGVPERGHALVRDFNARLDALARATASLRRPKVACIEWLDPVMIAGGWMPDLVRIAGGEPVIVTESQRFATVTWDDVHAAAPDVLVVMPCGFDIDRTLQEALPGPCWIVDGNAYFNRPGPRLADSAELLASLLHPDNFPAREGALEFLQ